MDFGDLLLEDGTSLLLESGTSLLLEGSEVIPSVEPEREWYIPVPYCRPPSVLNLATLPIPAYNGRSLNQKPTKIQWCRPQ